MISIAVWTSLQGIFKLKGAVGSINLQHDFFRTFAEEGANMEKHVWKLCGIQQELKAQVHYISDTEFSDTLLTSLPDSSSEFITAVNASRVGTIADVLIA